MTLLIIYLLGVLVMLLFVKDILKITALCVCSWTKNQKVQYNAISLIADCNRKNFSFWKDGEDEKLWRMYLIMGVSLSWFCILSIIISTIYELYNF